MRQAGVTFSQQGQVLIEAVVVMLVLVVMLLSIHHVGVRLFDWLQVFDRVFQWTHHKAVFHDVQPSPGIALQQGQRDRSHTKVQSQWGLGSRYFVTAASVKTPSVSHHHSVQSSAWLSGVGVSGGAKQTQTKIQSNVITWQAQSLQSQLWVNAVKPGLIAIDLPWYRASPETDWLSQWTQSSPYRLSPPRGRSRGFFEQINARMNGLFNE